MKVTIIAGNGMGGTEKAAFLYAAELAKRGHEVEALTDPNGCRSRLLVDAGVKIRHIGNSKKEFTKYFETFQPDILHQYVPGYGNHRELYEALRVLGTNRPRLVQTNIFGQLLDFYDCGDIDMSLFITHTSGMQAFERMRIYNGSPDPKHHNVVFFPITEDMFQINSYLGDQFRQSIGVDADEYLAIRIGRPGGKWEAWECEAFKTAREKNPKLRLFLMEPKDSVKKAVLAGKYGDGIIIRPATADPEYLLSVYSAADVMFQASSFGESFGYTLAEGMAAGMPVITLSTPWGDQAQTELVSHGETGIVCRTIQGMALALAELSLDREKSRAFGTAGLYKIRVMASIGQEVDLLEEIFNFLLYEKSSPLMNQRFKDWQQFILRRTKQLPCYEADHKLRRALIRSSIYNTYRQSKHLIRYLLIKLKGQSVYPPKWL